MDENGKAVTVTVKDIGGLDMQNPAIPDGPPFPAIPYTITYQAAHPGDADVTATATREAYVTIANIMPLALDVDNADYAFDAATGTLTVKTNTGTTAWRTDANIVGTPADRSVVKSVVIENMVTAIGDRAFDGCPNLTLASLPSGLATIGTNAFGGCNSLTRMEFPAALTSMGNNAFDGCDRLAALAFMGGTAPTVGTNAFMSLPATGTLGAFDVPEWDSIPDIDILLQTRKGVALSYSFSQSA